MPNSILAISTRTDHLNESNSLGSPNPSGQSHPSHCYILRDEMETRPGIKNSCKKCNDVYLKKVFFLSIISLSPLHSMQKQFFAYTLCYSEKNFNFDKKRFVKFVLKKFLIREKGHYVSNSFTSIKIVNFY